MTPKRVPQFSTAPRNAEANCENLGSRYAISQSIHGYTCLSAYLSVDLSSYLLSICLPFCLSPCLSIYLSIHLAIQLPIHLYMNTHTKTQVCVHVCIYIYTHTYMHICSQICVYVYLFTPIWQQSFFIRLPDDVLALAVKLTSMHDALLQGLPKHSFRHIGHEAGDSAVFKSRRPNLPQVLSWSPGLGYGSAGCRLCCPKSGHGPSCPKNRSEMWVGFLRIWLWERILLGLG